LLGIGSEHDLLEGDDLNSATNRRGCSNTMAAYFRGVILNQSIAECRENFK